MTKKELKAAQNQLKMLQNVKNAIEQMTDTECFDCFGISRTQALKNTTIAIAKTEQQIHRAEHPLTDIDKKLYEIAAKHLIAVEERRDLEIHRSDGEDFFEVSVWGLAAALKEAYEAGRRSK